MAQLLTIRLVRHDSSTPWGFRLQGGKDFGTPLLIQKVNMGSLAEKAGLQVGDALIRVSGQEVADQRHKDAQDIIVKAGNCVEMAIQRGALSTWKPSVTPVGTTPLPNSYVSSTPSPVTKASLAATNKNPSPKIGPAYNNVSKPYSPQMNGGYTSDNGSVKSIVNKQYNTPVGIYSDESIAETLSAQTEVLAGGVLGVNFKKNEKNYNAERSEVFKMVQEVEKEPKSPEPETAFIDSSVITQSTPVIGLRHVSAPQTKPISNSSSSSPGQNICADCEKLIVGVFVRIKDKNLHVECFKCATCGTSLKNVGYYSINNKLYCDIHAKMIARQNPPVSNLEPVTAPSPSTTYGSPKLTSFPQTPISPQTLAPVPFHTPRQTHVPAPQIRSQHVVNNVNSTNTTANSAVNSYSSTLTSSKAGQFYTLKPKTFSKGGGGTDSSGATVPGFRGGSSAGYSVPRRGRGVLNQQNLTPGARIPLCAHCNSQIRGPFVTALGKIWCPEHFVCVNQTCHRSLMDIGFVEEPSGLYCEYCFEQYLAPTCSKCVKKIKGDCLNAIGKHFHPECFTCAYCGKLFGNSPFFLEEGLPYCENDWNELFTTKCFACGFPIEAGDRWVEALNNNYHSPCFNCTICKANLEGQSFYAKGGRPFCKNHAR